MVCLDLKSGFRPNLVFGYRLDLDLDFSLLESRWLVIYTRSPIFDWESEGLERIRLALGFLSHNLGFFVLARLFYYESSISRK